MASSANPSLPSPDEPFVRAFIHERFAELFLSQSRRAQIGLTAAAAVVATLWAARADTAHAPLLWMAVVLVVMALRYRYTHRFVRAFGEENTTRAITFVLGINGVLMSVPLCGFNEFTDLDRASVAIILIGSATASVATTSGYRSVFLAFAAPMLGSLSLAWVLAAKADATSPARFGIGLLILAFLMFLVSIGKQVHTVFEEASRFRHGAEQLNRELQRALEVTREANRAKTHFLAAASHDLRQPIHSMNVLVAALTLRPLDDRSREIVGLLESVNQTLGRQLDSLLDISKLDAGTIKPTLQVERLDLLVAAHHASLTPVARERGIHLALALDADLAVRTDAALLGRVLSNLTDNALKFTRRGGTVTLGVVREGHEALLRVADTGIGIPAGEQERVFAEFYQVGNSERDRARGLGLGLSIVRRLCDLLGAAVQLESAPRQGTCVTLRLPEVEAEPRVKVDEPVRQIRRGLSVLVVDDEQFVRESMRLLLSELGCVVHLADGTAQATAVARACPIDIVLTDYRLRDGDSGLMAMNSVQAIRPRVRAALITGDTAPDRIQDAQKAGVPLLHKPVTLEHLLNLLENDTP